MKITFKEQPTDPSYPIMAGKTPLSKEFNKRQKNLWEKGNFDKFDLEKVSTVVLFEILVDDYNKRHTADKKSNKR